MDNHIMPKFHICETCDFKCSKLSNFNKHLSTRKHQNNVNDNKKMPKNATLYSCIHCNKDYKFLSGLSRHKKTCNYEKNLENILINKDKLNNTENDNNEELKELVCKLITCILFNFSNWGACMFVYFKLHF